MKAVFCSLILTVLVWPLAAQTPIPELNAESAVLISAASGQVLFEKNADRLCPPASMTKLVCVYTALRIWERQGRSLDSRFLVPPAADFRAAPPRSSLMFLQAGQIVSLRELLHGMMIPSGNDAAVAVALLTTGSVASFVEAMNISMRELGLTNCRFTDSSGYSEQNVISPREFAFFCRHLIRTYPEVIPMASLPEIIYPQAHNLNGTVAVYGPMRQLNHNEIIGSFPGADGLKTGYIDASGNNVALTAQRDGTRFIAVLTGIRDSSSARRSWKRTVDAARLLSYAFDRFCDYRLIFSPIYDEDGSALHARDPIVTLEKDRIDSFSFCRRGNTLIPMQSGVALRMIGLEQKPLVTPAKSFILPHKTKFVKKFDMFRFPDYTE